MHSRRRIPAASAQTICRFQPVRLSVWPFNRLVSTEARDCVMSGSLSQSEYLRDFDQEMCPINLRLVWNLNRQIVQRSDPGHAAAHGNGPGIPDQMPFIGQTTRDARDLIRSTAARYSERAWLAPVRLRVIAQVVEIYVSWAAQEDPHPCARRRRTPRRRRRSRPGRASRRASVGADADQNSAFLRARQQVRFAPRFLRVAGLRQTRA
jgi:hypothetical protein